MGASRRERARAVSAVAGLIAEQYAGHLAAGYPDGWTQHGAQAARFRAALDLLSRCGIALDGRTLHDAGCGTGALRAWLPDGCEWIGTDARAGMAGVRLDLLTGAIPFADVTVVSGTLAFHSTEAALVLLGRLWRSTEAALVLNHAPGLGSERARIERWAALHGLAATACGYTGSDRTWLCVRDRG